MKRALYLALFLALTAALAGGILSFVNDLTKDTIAAAQIEKEKENLEKIFPGSEFVQKSEDVETEEGILDLFEVVNEGYVYKVVSSGYGGDIVYLVGFNEDHTIKGIAVISHSETPGFGDVIETEGYTSKFVGKTGSDALDVHTGATVSSNAINRGIINAATHLSGGDLVVEEPDVELSGTILLNDEKVDGYAAEIISKEADGDNTVYTVSVEGYGLNNAEYPNPDYKENVFEITKDADNAIVDIKMIEFGDTKGFGDHIDNSKYFELFKGISETDAEVDTFTNATYTSYSLFSAIRAVLEDN